MHFCIFTAYLRGSVCNRWWMTPNSANSPSIHVVQDHRKTGGGADVASGAAI